MKHPLYRIPLCLSLFFVLAGDTYAHKMQHIRVFHVMVKGSQIECYINLLLPNSPKSRLWQRLFDRNRNGQLEAKEQLALGRYLQTLVRRGVGLSIQGKPLALRFKEVQNSRLRGDSRKSVYSWDYRFSAHTSTQALRGERHLKLHVAPLVPNEQTPVALIAMDGSALKATQSSYTIQRAGIDRAICKLDQRRRTCLFVLTPKAPITTHPSPLRNASTRPSRRAPAATNAPAQTPPSPLLPKD